MVQIFIIRGLVSAKRNKNSSYQSQRGQNRKKERMKGRNKISASKNWAWTIKNIDSPVNQNTFCTFPAKKRHKRRRQQYYVCYFHPPESLSFQMGSVFQLPIKGLLPFVAIAAPEVEAAEICCSSAGFWAAASAAAPCGGKMCWFPDEAGTGSSPVGSFRESEAS